MTGLQPPSIPSVDVSLPSPHVLLITLNRPRQLNSLPRALHAQLAGLYAWYDAQPHLRCAVLTGTGRAFCVGADLKEWFFRSQDSAASSSEEDMHEDGFGGLSNRRGKKPVIAAVNGLCLGGGFEMVLNADMVLAADGATFGLPEVKRGVVAIAGALPRLTRLVGRPRASEMALLGRTYTARQMEAWGVVNRVVPADELMGEALSWAEEAAGNSPDSVVVSRLGLWDAEDDVRRSTVMVGRGPANRALMKGANLSRGTDLPTKTRLIQRGNDPRPDLS
ncbi:hypothetical protein S7711_03494 [Stachybotrys chartarum IBT 7711]|uniref:Enoyl-CoA hydratase n=1 Tax=Stachybotrys chartarum (strain CBS 109288 / IBT 7711) TaxID=1280523 RepID=A0A084AFX5_STACB|nr:hypothetical protein S7711_03494 [Stachybotrys chartarum IBT 7711]